MPNLTQSDLSDLARYPASLRSAARVLWGGGVVNDRSGGARRAHLDTFKKGAVTPPGETI